MMGGPFGVSALSPQSLYGLPCSAEVPCGPIRPCAVTIEAVAVPLHWARAVCRPSLSRTLCIRRT